jgi:hypothetical protein
MVTMLVGTLVACTNIGGWSEGGSYGVPHTDTSGYATAIQYYQAAYTIGGNYHSRSGSVKYTNGDIRVVRAHRVVHPLTECPWATYVCTGHGTANPEGRVWMQTFDTSGDGYISGAGDWYPWGSDCGITDTITAATGPNMPSSAIWQDTPSCKAPDSPAGYWPSSITDRSDITYGMFTNQRPNSPVSAFRGLSFETVQQLVNSLESSDVSTQMVNGQPMKVAQLQVTNLKIGGDSYRPINVNLNLYNFNAMVWDRNNPGMKLMAGWAANKVESLLNRGATSIRMEIEINGSVTLTRDALGPDIHITEPGYHSVETWRSFATTNLRQD